MAKNFFLAFYFSKLTKYNTLYCHDNAELYRNINRF